MVQYIIAKHGAIHICKALCNTYHVKARASACKHPGKVTSKHGHQPTNTQRKLCQSMGISHQASWKGYIKARESARKHPEKVSQSTGISP